MKELLEVEKKITELVTADPFWSRHADHLTALEPLLRKRQRILNRLWQPTEESMARLRQVNQHLLHLTQQLHARYERMAAKVPALMDAPDFDDDSELTGTLRYHYNSEESVLRLPDDARYASDFPLMIQTLAELTDAQGQSDIEYIHTKTTPKDDGSSWNEPPFRGRPEFEDIIICHAVHDLCCHKLYSLPDLVRLNDFWCEVTFVTQSITAQDGTRYNPQSSL